MSEIIQMSVQLWRQKSLEGTLSIEEMRLAVAAIRKERLGQGAVSAASKEKKVAVAAKKKPVDSDALLGELGL
jgi:exoribonuclease R